MFTQILLQVFFLDITITLVEMFTITCFLILVHKTNMINKSPQTKKVLRDKIWVSISFETFVL